MTFQTMTAALALTVASVSAASAATATFDFTGRSGYAPYSASYTFSDHDLDLTVSAAATPDGRHFAKNPLIGKWHTGLGILNGPLDDNHMLDGRGWDEFMIFSFSKPLDRIDTISFSHVDRNDRFTLWGNDGAGWSRVLGGTEVPLNGFPSTYTFGENFAGSLFAVGAEGPHDNYKIAGMSVSYGDIAPIPLPAGGLLLVTGLMGLGVARHLRNRA